MTTFKKFLLENSYGGMTFSQYRLSVIDWFNKHVGRPALFKESRLSIDDDGTVNYAGDMFVVVNVGRELPFKLGVIKGGFLLPSHGNKLRSTKNFPRRVEGAFSINHGELASMIGLPNYVKNYLDLSDNKIKNLDGFPDETHGDVYLNSNKLKTLTGIHKKIKKMNGTLNILDNPVTSSILGIILIDGIDKLVTVIDEFDGPYLKYHQAINIVAKHIGKGKAGVLDAQEELQDAGLDEFAEL